MRPVIFVKHPNQNRFIGTFDMDDLQEWWLSEPLPGDVAEVVDVDWAYAQYHVCVCRMDDGSYSIIRTKDYGQSWYEVLNLRERIYSITRIDYGWLLAATASGWYESTRSGLEGTWSKVSTQAPGCKTVVNLGENILVAHDGSYVWRSTDIARNWTATLNCHSLYYKAPHSGFTTRSYSGDVYPALAGFGAQVFAGAGPHLLMSDDEAQSWTIPWGWPPFYGGSSGNKGINSYYDKTRLLQIVHTGGFNNPQNPGVTYAQYMHTWMFRVYIPTLGVVRCLVSDGGDYNYIPKFDQPFIGYTAGGITSYEVLRPGSSEIDMMVFCPNPTPRYSLTRGWTWSELDPTEFTVYLGDPEQEINAYTNPYIEDDYSEWQWSGEPCHNSGKFIYKDGIVRRGLSYDCDFLTKRVQELDSKWDMDALLAVVKEVGPDMDLLAKIAFDNGYSMDDYRKKAFDKAYLGHAFVQDTFEFGADHDMILVHRYIWPWYNDILQQKALDLGWYNDILQRKAMVDSCEMAMYLVEDLWDEIVNDIDKTMPQVWRLETPVVPKRVLDSRVEDFDDAGGA